MSRSQFIEESFQALGIRQRREETGISGSLSQSRLMAFIFQNWQARGLDRSE